VDFALFCEKLHTHTKKPPKTGVFSQLLPQTQSLLHDFIWSKGDKGAATKTRGFLTFCHFDKKIPQEGSQNFPGGWSQLKIKNTGVLHENVLGLTWPHNGRT